jgi:hypothetical protein
VHGVLLVMSLIVVQERDFFFTWRYQERSRRCRSGDLNGSHPNWLILSSSAAYRTTRLSRYFDLIIEHWMRLESIGEIRFVLARGKHFFC